MKNGNATEAAEENFPDGLDDRQPDYASALKQSKHFIPSPEEIRAGCLEIQAGWSDAEREKRDISGKSRVDYDPGKVHRTFEG